MKIHSPSMSELHAFVTAVRLGSFTRAADQLCVTQGAISRAIARLEDHFGQPLLARSTSGVSPTVLGERLLAGIAGPLDAIEALSRELRMPASANRLCLSVVPTLASVWLMPRVPDFRRLHPDVELEFAPYRRNEDFSGDRPHAAILSGVPGERPGWRCDYVIGREVVVICHPDRLQARRAQGRWNDPAELLTEPLLSHVNAPLNWQHWFNAVGVTAALPPAQSMDQVSIIVRAVMADIGIAVLQRCLVQEEIENSRVAVPFDHPVALNHGYILCSPERYEDHPALAAFRQWLLAAAAPGTPCTPSAGLSAT